jgi:uncharacterized membrane protein YebE (DUF533 family)
MTETIPGVMHNQPAPPARAYDAAVEITREQRQTLLALCCKVAWADGVVAEEERQVVFGLMQRLGWDSASKAEVEEWLATGPPEPDLAGLPEGLGQMAVYEALRIAEADGEIDDRELEIATSVMERVFRTHPPHTPIARLALEASRKLEKG